MSMIYLSILYKKVFNYVQKLLVFNNNYIFVKLIFIKNNIIVTYILKNI